MPFSRWTPILALVMVACLGCGDDKGSNSGGLGTWTATFGGDLSDQAIEILPGPDGGLIVAYEDQIINPSARLTRLDDDGNQLWDVTVAGDTVRYVRGMASLGDRIVLLTSEFSRSSGRKYLHEISWTGTTEESQELKEWYYHTPEDIAVLANDDVVIAGEYYDGLLVWRMDTDGELMWEQEVDADTFRAELWCGSAITSQDGGVLIVGQTGPPYNPSWHKVFLIKVSENGDEVWRNRFGSESVVDERGVAVAPAGDEGYFVTSYSWTTEGTGLTSLDIFVYKVSQSGTVIWERTLGGESPEEVASIAATDDGACVVAGWTESYGAGGKDVYLAKINTDGDIIWERAIGGPGDEIANAIVRAPDGGFIVAGSTQGVGEEHSDAYVIRTDRNGNAN